MTLPVLLLCPDCIGGVAHCCGGMRECPEPGEAERGDDGVAPS